MISVETMALSRPCAYRHQSVPAWWCATGTGFAPGARQSGVPGQALEGPACGLAPLGDCCADSVQLYGLLGGLMPLGGTPPKTDLFPKLTFN